MGNKSRSNKVSWRWSNYTNLPGYVAAGTNYAQGASIQTYGYNRVGNNVPTRRQLIAACQNASGEMTVTVSNAEADPLDCTLSMWVLDPATGSKVDCKLVAKGHYLSCNLPLPLTNHSGAFAEVEADRIARRALHQNFTKRRRQISGIVFAGEFGKAVQMVMKPAKALHGAVSKTAARAANAVKRVRVSNGNPAKVAADLYLEAQFGWKPLIADVRDGAKAIARIATRDALERQQFRAYGNAVTPISASRIGSQVFGVVVGAPIHYEGERIDFNEAEVIYYGAYVSKLQRPDTLVGLAEDLVKKSGFNFEDWIPSAWELVPWSFFVDYFTNVGEVLEECANGYTDIGWVTKVVIKTTTRLDKSTPNHALTKQTFLYGNQWISLEGTSTICKSSYRTVVRTKNAGDLFRRELYFRLPVDRQWLNIAALAAGARPPKPFY